MREKERATRVVYVRHGQTDFPSNRIYCDGREDPPLNEAGQAQAAQIAAALSRLKIDAIYASPCQRTRMTAGAIANHHPMLSVGHDAALMERNFGIWEGLDFHEIETRFPDEYLAWKANQAAFKPEGGESVYDLAARVSPAVAEMVSVNRGGCVVIVSHVGPIRALVADALGMPLEKYRQLTIDPASATCVDYGKSQNNMILFNFHARHWGGVDL